MAGEGDAKETLDFNTSHASCNINLARLRERVKNYIDKHHYDSAVFWADKLVSLSNGTMEDVYWYAQSLFLTGQYHRAANQILSRKLHKVLKRPLGALVEWQTVWTLITLLQKEQLDPSLHCLPQLDHMCCRYLAAKCYYECREYQEALNVLDLALVPPSIYNQPINKRMSFANQSIVEPEQTDKCMESSISLLRGQIYEAMANRMLAIECYREAIRQDVYCYEAFDRIVSHHMLSAQEERELLDSLAFGAQCPQEEIDLVKFLYENKLKKYDKPKEAVIPDSLQPLKENLDIVVSLAERHYYNCDFRECHTLTSRVLSEDLYNDQCLPIHIAVLVELKKENSIFYLAHKLVDLYPNKPVSWFAVGCYYLLIKQKEPARRYLSKATEMQQLYGPAWLAYGHSFAKENEHDQAMAAYFTAAQLMKGCHLPALYIGLEYGLTNNSKLAEQFFTQALSIAPDDPFVLHEMGVIAFQNEDFTEAEKYFKDALKRIEECGKQTIVEKWEPLLNNLGHTCRKLKKYDEALQYHQQARILDPQSPSTYSAIGYVYALMGDSLEAVDFFHKALAIRRDDAFSTTMLSNLIESLMTELTPGEDLEDSPVFEKPTVSGLFSFGDKMDTSGDSKPPAPVMRLTSKLDESSDGDNENSSSLVIEEVEMGDCD